MLSILRAHRCAGLRRRQVDHCCAARALGSGPIFSSRRGPRILGLTVACAVHWLSTCGRMLPLLTSAHRSAPEMHGLAWRVHRLTVRFRKKQLKTKPTLQSNVRYDGKSLWATENVYMIHWSTVRRVLSNPVVSWVIAFRGCQTTTTAILNVIPKCHSHQMSVRNYERMVAKYVKVSGTYSINVYRERREDTDWGGVSAAGTDRPWIGQVMSEGCHMAPLEIEP